MEDIITPEGNIPTIIITRDSEGAYQIEAWQNTRDNSCLSLTVYDEDRKSYTMVVMGGKAARALAAFIQKNI